MNLTISLVKELIWRDDVESYLPRVEFEFLDTVNLNNVLEVEVIEVNGQFLRKRRML